MNTKMIKKYLNIDLKLAEKVEELVSGRLSPESLPGVRKWIRQCYCRPSPNEILMYALNETLGAAGVEGVFDSHGDVRAIYVNRGDMYSPTILMDDERLLLLTSAGEFAELLNNEE